MSASFLQSVSLRTGDALLGYGGIADAVFRREEGDADLALVAVAAAPRQPLRSQ